MWKLTLITLTILTPAVWWFMAPINGALGFVLLVLFVALLCAWFVVLAYGLHKGHYTLRGVLGAVLTATVLLFPGFCVGGGCCVLGVLGILFFAGIVTQAGIQGTLT